jgi:adenylate cyclase
MRRQTGSSALHQAGIALGQLGRGRAALTLLMLALAVVLGATSWEIPLMRDAERPIFDLRQSLTAPVVKGDDRIVMVVYTDETLEKTGQRSPVDRGILARALKRIDAMGAKAIGIDILIDQKQPQDEELIAAFTGHEDAGCARPCVIARGHGQDRTLAAGLSGGVSRPHRQSQSELASIILQEDRTERCASGARKSEASRTRLPNAMVPEAKDFADYTGQHRLPLPQVAKTGRFSRICRLTPLPTIRCFSIPEMQAGLEAQVRGATSSSAAISTISTSSRRP